MPLKRRGGYSASAAFRYNTASLDPECYAGDYSETECLSDSPRLHINVPDVTEIYRRKPMIISPPDVPPPSCCHHRNHHQQYVSSGQQRHMPSPPQYVPNSSFGNAHNLPTNEDRYRRYQRHFQNQDSFENGLFSSTPYVSTNTRICQDKDFLPHIVTTKKYPVTVRTPRYYKYPATLYKRPSKLCLPMCCEPDPAVMNRRSRKCLEEPQQCYPRKISQSKSRKMAMKEFAAKLIDSEGDQDYKLKENNEDNETYRKSNDFVKYLKPRMPASIREKRNRLLKLKATKIEENEENEEIIDKRLDAKLNQMYAEAFGNDNDDEIIDKKNEEVVSKKSSRITNTKELNKSNTSSVLNLSKSCSSKAKQRISSLDDNVALELHRSKNYVLSLIDKAISRELGTVPNDKCDRSEFENMNPKKAINFLNKIDESQQFPQKSSASVPFQKTIAQSRPDDMSNLEAPDYPYKFDEDANVNRLKELKNDCIYRIQNNVMKLMEIETFLDVLSEK